MKKLHNHLGVFVHFAKQYSKIQGFAVLEDWWAVQTSVHLLQIKINYYNKNSIESIKSTNKQTLPPF